LIEKTMVDVITASPFIKLDYATACDPQSFEQPGDMLPETLTDLLLVVPAHFGTTRLNENLLLRDGHWLISHAACALPWPPGASLLADDVQAGLATRGCPLLPIPLALSHL